MTSSPQPENALQHERIRFTAEEIEHDEDDADPEPEKAPSNEPERPQSRARQ